MNSENRSPTPASTPPTRRRKRRFTPPPWYWIVVALAAVSVVVVRSTEILLDHAIGNVITLIAAFVVLISLLVWFSFLGDYSRRVRMIPLIGSLVVVAALAVVFRIERVSGELVPTFALRFSRKPDELLDKPRLDDRTSVALTVDLRTTAPDDFPQFLGPHRDLSVDHVELARDWTTRPPRLVWRREIGAGWCGFSVVGGYAVTMEQRGEMEMVTCYHVQTGEVQWAHSTPTRYEAVLSGVGPRATPTIDEGNVYTLGATGHLLCLDGATGRVRWEKDLWSEFGLTAEDEARDVPYGRANSPLVVGDLVIVPAGGPGGEQCVSLVAYDKKTGDPVWKGGNRQISYCSPALASLGGVEQVLIVNQDYASGHDLRTGRVLWEYDWPGRSSSNANVSQAVPLPPDRVFLSKGYSRGAALVQLVPQADGTFDPQEVWSNLRVMRTKFTNVAIRDGYVYGLSDGILECVELQTGRRVWKSGRYGHGQILRVGDLLLVSAESGELSLVEATPDRRNSVLGHFQAVEGMTWNNLALSGPYLLVRNAQEAACYQLPLK